MIELIAAFLIGFASGSWICWLSIQGTLMLPDRPNIANMDRWEAEMYADAELARNVEPIRKEIDDKICALLTADQQPKDLFIHLADPVLVPYLVMINEGQKGPLRYCGLEVKHDHKLEFGQWRIECSDRSSVL